MRIVSFLVSLMLFLAIFVGGVLYTFNKTRTYQATGKLELLEAPKNPYVSLDQLLDEDEILIKNPKSPIAEQEVVLNTQFSILKSQQIVLRVEQRIQNNMRERFMAPYIELIEVSGPISPMEVLSFNRSISHVPKSSIFQINYIHPDPVIAADISNLFMKEYINYQLESQINGYMMIVEDLRVRLKMMDERIMLDSVILSELRAPPKPSTHSISKIEQTISSNEAFRAKLQTAYNEAKLRSSFANPIARIVDQAFPPLSHNSPQVSRNLSYSFFGGLAAALTLFFGSRQLF
ncbi:MAG: hypothetical protein ACSHYA_12920 [Opitutaceae bacterium]